MVRITPGMDWSRPVTKSAMETMSGASTKAMMSKSPVMISADETPEKDRRAVTTSRDLPTCVSINIYALVVT